MTPYEADAVRERRAARVVLLIEGHDPGRPELGWYWFTVGGGVDEGESVAHAAVREVREETGLAIEADDLGAVVREDEVEFGFEGTTLHQREWFFVVRVPAFEPDATGWEPLETRAQRGMRWWTLDELRTTEETIFPADLADLIARRA